MPSYDMVKEAIKILCSDCEYLWQGFCEHNNTHRGKIDISSTQVHCMYKKANSPVVVFSTLKEPK